MSSVLHSSPLPWWRDRLLLGVAVLFAAWCAMALGWPLSGDASVFHWMGDTALRGRAPYADAFDTKGPAAWLPSLLAQVVTGRSTWGIRAFDILMVLAALRAMRGIAQRLEQPGAGRVAIALYAVWYAGLDYWQSAQPDGWVASWLILACWAALAGGRTGAVMAGALVGFATMSKPFYFGYLVVVWMLVARPGVGTRAQRSVAAMLALAGAVGMIGLLLLWLRTRGALDAFLEVQRWNRDVYASFGSGMITRIPEMLTTMLVMPWGIVAPMALFGSIRPTRAHRVAITALAVGFAGAVAGVILQGKGWQYHWLPMLPFLALLADFGLGALRSDTAGEIAGRFRLLAVVLALGVATLAPVQQLYRWGRSRVSADARERFERREFEVYGRYAGSVSRIVDSLATLEPDSARILIWAMVPGPHYLRGLPTDSRYALIRPLYDGAGSKYRARYRTEFERYLRERPPRWWLVPTDSLVAADGKLRSFQLADYPAADSSLRSQFRRAGGSDTWQIYERLATVPAR